jgi:hypothetical protein
MQDRTIGFVWGYLPWVDRRSETAEELGLQQRFSIATNRYPDSAPGLYETVFDLDLVLGMCAALLALFPHDTLRAVDWVGGTHLGLPAACLADPEDGGYDSFSSAVLLRDGRPKCYIEYEAYDSCGGPHPYHDAYVYAFYSAGVERGLLQDALFAFCSEKGVIMTDIISGGPNPVRRPWLRRLMASLR